MKSLLFILSCSFLCLEVSAQDTIKTTYAGHVDFAMGNFGAFDYPVKGDSVFVFLKGDKLGIVIYSADKNLSIKSVSKEFSGLRLVKKKEYKNIEAPAKITRTGNYDMKFSEKKGDNVLQVFLAHYSDGNSAVLTIMTESEGLRMDNLCVINLRLQR